MLTNWEAKGIVAVREFETIADKRVTSGLYHRKEYVTLRCFEKLEFSSPEKILSTGWDLGVWDEVLLLFIRKNENR